MPDNDPSDPMIRVWAAKRAATGRHPRRFAGTQRTPRAAEYRTAGRTEVDVLEANETWELVRRSELPPGTIVHDGMWVWIDKYDKDANDTEIRGRYVFLGNEQTRGVDYDETYSPTGRPATQRCCHAVASSEKLIAKQADVKAAFLQARVADDPLDIDIYMEQVDGFEDPDHPRAEWVCKLIKTLYGMRYRPEKPTPLDADHQVLG